MKNILVAGAGAGIGKSIFEFFVKDRTNVYGISRRGEMSDLLTPGKNYQCDLENEVDIIRFANQFKSQIEKLDCLYLAAGNGLFKPIQEIAAGEWDKHFNLNVKSNFLLLRELYPLLQKGENSFVCIVSSTAGKYGFPDSSAYCASKHAVAGLAKAIREEWKKDHIRVFILYLGAVSTAIWDTRPEFNKKDMIHPDELAKFLTMLTELPESINLDEIHLMPMKGVL